MSEAWLAFARDGLPAYRELPTWPAYTTEQRATMIFDRVCRSENDPFGEERKAWDGVHITSVNE